MQLLLRRLHLAVIGVVLALVGAACFSEPESAQLFTTAAPPVATTEPVGIPLDPTPTPLALPDVASPPVAVEFPTPMPADEHLVPSHLSPTERRCNRPFRFPTPQHSALHRAQRFRNCHTPSGE